MKFTKILALLLALTMLFAFTVACDSGDKDAETSAAETTTQAPPFISSILVIALDAEGEEVTVIEEEEATYNGLKASNALNIFDIVTDYCFDNDITYTLDQETGRFVEIGGYSVAEGGVMWTYSVNDKVLSDYDGIIANNSEIVITMVVHEAE